jgi:hypothetical protein
VNPFFGGREATTPSVIRIISFSSLELLRKGEKRDSKEGFESLEALPLSWLGAVFVPFRTLFLFLFFVA